MSALVDLILPHVIHGRPWLEFGVSGGDTFRQLAPHATVIYGFDWFRGLPEDWRDEDGNLQDPKGKFRADPPTDLPPHAHLVVGLFQDTLPGWIADHPVRMGFVHIDCDLYSSTKFVLEQLEPYLDGTVIAFDEIGPFPAGKWHEGRAWVEFMERGRYESTYIGRQHRAGAIYKMRER